MRTDDVTYGADYWDTLDGGRGYTDSTMWEDLAHDLKEVFVIRNGVDCSGQTHAVDVGCAGGYLTKHLRRRGIDGWGLDFSQYALDHADPATMEYLRWFNLEGVDESYFGEDTFDLLTCFETLEHIQRDFALRAVKHLWKLLKPGGIAVLTICVTGQPGSDDDPTHVNVTDRSWWEQLFAQQHWITETDMLRQLQHFWLFSLHLGVFVLRKPANLNK